jgi:hypothetical protein
MHANIMSQISTANHKKFYAPDWTFPTMKRPPTEAAFNAGQPVLCTDELQDCDCGRAHSPSGGFFDCSPGSAGGFSISTRIIRHCCIRAIAHAFTLLP